MSQTTIFIIEALLKYGPGLARQLVKIFSRQTDPTLDEWEALFVAADKPYADYISGSGTGDGGPIPT